MAIALQSPANAVYSHVFNILDFTSPITEAFLRTPWFDSSQPACAQLFGNDHTDKKLWNMHSWEAKERLRNLVLSGSVPFAALR